MRLSLRIDALCKQMRIYVFACFYSPPPPRTFNLSSAAAHCRSISSFSPPCRRGETRAPMPILCVRWPGQQSQESSFWARPTYSDMVHNAHNMTIERQSDVSAPGLLLLLLLSDLPSASMTLAAICADTMASAGRPGWAICSGHHHRHQNKANEAPSERTWKRSGLGVDSASKGTGCYAGGRIGGGGGFPSFLPSLSRAAADHKSC